MNACLLALLSLVAPAANNEGYYMQPSVRGDTIVFVSQGDIWRVGVKGGLAQALTGHVAPESHPAISPDGKLVAFTGTYEGPSEAYTMSIDGGLPTRLTFEGGMDVVGWTNDGKVLATTEIRSTLPTHQLVAVDPVSRRQSFVPLAQAAEGSYDSTGKTIFFTRFNFQGSHTKRYKGGTAQNIWRYTEGAPEAVPLTTNYEGTSKNPMWWNHRVYFLSDRDGTMNVWSMNEQGAELRQITHEDGWDIQSATLDDGKIAYQLGADIHLYDVAKNSDQLVKISLASDFVQTREQWIKSPMDYVSAAQISPDGGKVVLTSRGQVFVAPATSGRFVEASRKPGVRYRNAMFSADGKSVLALSDESGETEWWRLPANGVGAAEQLTQGTNNLTMSGIVSPDGKRLAYADKNQNLWMFDLTTKKTTKVISSPDDMLGDIQWSPDSQWLSFTMPTRTFSRIMLYSVATGTSVPVTSDRSDSYSAVWSPDGKWLYFLSDRTFNTSVPGPWGPRQPEPYFDKQTKIYQLALQKGLHWPFQPEDELVTAPEPPAPKGPLTVKIDLDGLPTRLWEVPVGSGNYGHLTVNDKRLLVQSSQRGDGNDLLQIEISNKDVAAKPLASGIGGYELSRNGEKVLVRKGNLLFVFNAGGPASFDKPVDLSGWTFSMQPREEWKQMLTEAWRLERDYFYDPKLHSVDWNAVLKRYSPLVGRVRTREELSNLIGQMVGELTALHTFVVGGDRRRGPDSVYPASLGGVLTRDPSQGGYRVDRIYSGEPDYPDTASPLARPGVDITVGDVILSINGVDTLSAPDVALLLRNQAGKQVLLHVKEKATGKTRDCIAKPIDLGELGDLKYTDWEVSRRRMVEEASKNDIGYVHLRAMGGGDIAQWERDFYPVFTRSGLIIDVRNNGGGNIDSWILEKLLRKAWFYWQSRIGSPTWNMQWAFRGHVVVLCNEWTASDGEAFTEGIKRLGIGKVIGTRTWGGEIWLSFSNYLEDGGIASAAEFGVFGPEGKWLIENHGVDPDMIVDDLPHATYLGKDAQLEAAITYLQKQIREHPVPVPPRIAYPDKSFHKH